MWAQGVGQKQTDKWLKPADLKFPVILTQQHWPNAVQPYTSRRSRLWWPHKTRFWPCECNISVTPWGNFFKFNTNIHLDSRSNWWFGGQRSRSRWPHKTPLLKTSHSSYDIISHRWLIFDMTLEKQGRNLKLVWVVEADNHQALVLVFFSLQKRGAQTFIYSFTVTHPTKSIKIIYIKYSLSISCSCV